MSSSSEYVIAVDSAFLPAAILPGDIFLIRRDADPPEYWSMLAQEETTVVENSTDKDARVNLYATPSINALEGSIGDPVPSTNVWRARPNIRSRIHVFLGSARYTAAALGFPSVTLPIPPSPLPAGALPSPLTDAYFISTRFASLPYPEYLYVILDFQGNVTGEQENTTIIQGRTEPIMAKMYTNGTSGTFGFTMLAGQRSYLDMSTPIQIQRLRVIIRDADFNVVDFLEHDNNTLTLDIFTPTGNITSLIR